MPSESSESVEYSPFELLLMPDLVLAVAGPPIRQMVVLEGE